MAIQQPVSSGGVTPETVAQENAAYTQGAAREAAAIGAKPNPFGTPPPPPAPLTPLESFLSQVSAAGPGAQSYFAAQPNNPTSALDAATATVNAMVNQGVPEELAGQFIGFITGQLTGTGTPNHIPATQDEAVQSLYQQSFFKDRFPGIAKLGITPAQWIGTEQQYYQAASAAGMPGFVSQADAAQLIQGHVSVNELSERVTDAYNASKGADPTVKSALKAQGVNEADVAKFFLDPDNQINALTQKVTAGQVAGIAAEQGFQGLSAAQAAQVAAGVQTSSGGAPTPMTLTQVQQNAGIQTAEFNENLTRKAVNSNNLNTLSSATVLGAALGVGVGGQTVGQEQRNVIGAIQTKAGAASGGGGYSPTKRGTAVGSGSQEGAANDTMGG